MPNNVLHTVHPEYMDSIMSGCDQWAGQLQVLYMVVQIFEILLKPEPSERECNYVSVCRERLTLLSSWSSSLHEFTG